MNCFNDYQIERWVTGSEAPPEVWRHLNECDLCRRAFLIQSAWHSQFISSSSQAVQHATDKHMMVLFPLQDEVNKEGDYRLAAEGGIPTDVYAVMSFSSPEHNVVGRILHDRQSKRISLHLIAEDTEIVKGVKVKLIGPELEGHTDLDGCIDFGPLADFHCSAVHVQSPLAVFDLSTHHAFIERPQAEHSFVIKNRAHDEIQIDIEQEGARRQYRFTLQKIAGEPDVAMLKIVALSDRRVIQAQIRQGVHVLETEGAERILRIRVY